MISVQKFCIDFDKSERNWRQVYAIVVHTVVPKFTMKPTECQAKLQWFKHVVLCVSHQYRTIMTGGTHLIEQYHLHLQILLWCRGDNYYKAQGHDIHTKGSMCSYMLAHCNSCFHPPPDKTVLSRGRSNQYNSSNTHQNIYNHLPKWITKCKFKLNRIVIYDHMKP